jgi:membrane-bound lytic murein transglycosylase F
MGALRRLPRRIGLLIASAAVLASCAPPPPTPERIQARRELRVGTLNLPTTYYLGAHGPEGLEYSLVSAFAAELGVSLVIRTYPDEPALRGALRAREIDLAAGQLTWQGDWTGDGVASVAYDYADQVIVSRRGPARPRSIADLAGREVVVTEGSPQAAALESMQLPGGAPLVIRRIDPAAQGSTLDEILAGRGEATLVDARLFQHVRDAYPEIVRAFELDERRPVHWIVPRGATALRARIDTFLATMRDSGRIEALAEATTPSDRRMLFENARVFRTRIYSTLPDLKPWFEEASAETGLDWRLLAALGYQESQWNPRAVSPQGAQGVMMLVPDTAASVGVRDVWNARENILGGARYLLEVRNKLPERIREPDRTWLALAAYNMGYGHLEDARVITQMRGGDPDRWIDVRRNLPLLEQEAWYLRAKRGYARGTETVQLVDRVQQFLNVLEWRTMPPIETVFQPESEDPLPPPTAHASPDERNPRAPRGRGS